MSNPFLPIPARVEDVIVETPTIRTFVLKPAEPVPFRAGQFVQLEVPGVGEAPFTPSSSPKQSEQLEITILRTGLVTDALHGVEPGATLGVRGPFGKGYPTHRFADHDVLVIGGGVGLAPLRSLLYHLFEHLDDVKSVPIKYGARSPDELCFRRQHDQWAEQDKVEFIATIDRPATGWDGHVGLVTTLLDDLELDVKTTYAVSCGPEVMLKFVTWKLIDLGFPPEHIYLSMNRNMSCGMGLCGRCNIGPDYLCKDGPDMCYAAIKDIPYAWGSRMTDAVASICPFCSMGCSLGIYPGADSPYVGEAGIHSLGYDVDGRFNRGSLCSKGNMALELLTHSKRIESPQVRADGRLRSVGWDEAISEIAGRLESIRRESGSGAIGLCVGSLLTNQEVRAVAELGRALGTPHVGGVSPEDRTFLGGLGRSRASPAPIETVEQIESMTAMLAVGDVFSLAPCLSKAVLHARYDRRRNLLGTLSGTRNRTSWFGKPDIRCGLAREVAALALLLRAALEEGAGQDVAWREEALEIFDRFELSAMEGLAGIQRDAVAGLIGALDKEELTGIIVGSAFGETERPDLAAGLAALLAEATGSRFLALTQGPNALGVQRELAAAGHPDPSGLTTPEMFEAAATGDLRALLVFGCDPLAELPGSLARLAAERLDLLVTTVPLPGETSAVADFVLPALGWGEKRGTVINAFGAALELESALLPPGVARADLEIIDDLTGRLSTASALPGDAGAGPPSRSEASFFAELELYFHLERRELGTREVGSHLLLCQASASHAGDGWLTRHLSWPLHECPEPEVVLSERHAKELDVRAGDRVRLRSPTGEMTLSARIERRLPEAVVLAPPHEPSVRRLMRWHVDPALRDLDMRPGRVSVEPLNRDNSATPAGIGDNGNG